MKLKISHHLQSLSGTIEGKKSLFEEIEAGNSYCCIICVCSVCVWGGDYYVIGVLP